MSVLYHLSLSERTRDSGVCVAGPLIGATLDEGKIAESGEIVGWPTNVSVELSCDAGVQIERFLCAAHTIYFLYVTREACSILREARLRGLQLLPVRPVGPTAGLLDGMCLFHVTNRIAALDQNRSVFSYYVGKSKRLAGNVTGMTRVVLRSEAIPDDLDIFRLSEASSVIYVSERFKDVCQRSGVDSWVFSPAEIAFPPTEAVN